MSIVLFGNGSANRNIDRIFLIETNLHKNSIIIHNKMRWGNELYREFKEENTTTHSARTESHIDSQEFHFTDDDKFGSL